jgi:hypothetical protein
MPTTLDLASRLYRVAGLTGLLLIAGCTAPTQIAAVPVGPIPPGQSRIWFYRVYDPSLSLNLANVDLNGVRTASLSPSGPPLYRDVAPGHYRISPETVGVDVNQAKDVNIAAGQEIFVKILDDPTWVSGGDFNEFRRDTFYVWLMAPQLARAELTMPR